MSQLSWRSIPRRVEGRRIVGLSYGVEDGYLRIEPVQIPGDAQRRISQVCSELTSHPNTRPFRVAQAAHPGAPTPRTLG